jgi:hypothetical protein
VCVAAGDAAYVSSGRYEVYECRVRRSVLDGYEYVSGWPLSQGSNEREGGSLVKCLGAGTLCRSASLELGE